MKLRDLDGDEIVAMTIVSIVCVVLIALMFHWTFRASYQRDFEAACASAGGEVGTLMVGAAQACYKIEKSYTPIQILDTRNVR